MLTKLKAKVQSAMTAQAKAANTLGLTPNTVSAVGIILALLSALAYSSGRQNLSLAVVLLLLSGYCDMLDGALARLCQKTTPFGGFLDSLLDRYADSAVYAGIILGGFCTLPWGLIALVGSLLVSYARARAEAAEIKMESVGLAERAERITILAAASLTEIFLKGAMEAGIIILAILTNLTVLQRSLHAYKTLKKREKA
ncbi:MAG: archaetidylinositol phosphate synthase [Candidatus Bathyarchaeota archaeon]|jgi:archaetidylinositol phosphate synthase|nr:CDP-alcohol phosphatidyltransferase family protein [Candidatus Bathyarchaeota archaeon A05DMB-3]MDH7606197.1 archaetidylinositol phosphate synthase [Candidatus Bathyarchaeota archaeon]